MQGLKKLYIAKRHRKHSSKNFQTSDYSAWTLVTQKRPLVPFIEAKERILPDWATCIYKEQINQSAVIDKVVNLTLREFIAKL